MSVSDPLEKLRRCQLGCFEYGQCKANMHGAPSECPALKASAPVPQDYYETPGATDPSEAKGWSARKRALAPQTASPGGMDLSAKELHYWPYCGKCHEPFDFDKDAPFASCKCGTGEWGNPRPAAWVHDPRAPLTDEQIDRAADEWSFAVLLGKGSVAARAAFRAALTKEGETKS
jgi:hypothetical protein